MRAENLLSSLWAGLLLVLAAAPAYAGNATAAGAAAVIAVSSRWISVEAPLAGDDNQNGYTLFELGTSAGGPFDTAAASYGKLPGPSEWRTDVFGRGPVTPGTTYFARVTYFDPDGVTGANPQILGPITTPAFSPDAVTVGTAVASVRDTEIFVSLPVTDDANQSSGGTVDVATSPGGPWTTKCGSTFENNLPYNPKRCRVRSLEPGTDYWVRVTVSDSDGVMGANPQILGPIRYTGLKNLALGRPITADPGWGCCSSPSHLVDGRIQNDAWYFGFAWAGGTSGWAGGPPGFKQATVDLGAPTAFSRAVVWYHDPASVPTVWKIQYGDDGVSWTDAYSETQPVCRTTTDEMPGAWYLPACGHDAAFQEVTARYVRFTFDDRTLFRGLHGWAVELEVFDAPPANEPPSAGAGMDQDVAVDADCLARVNLDGTASSDPDGDPLVFTWSGPFGMAAGESPIVSLPPGVHTVTLTVDDGRGGTASDEVVITVRDLTPPVLASVTAAPGVLWPPDHKMRPVILAVSAADACDAAPPLCQLVSVASSEPVNGIGDGDTAPDWRITGDLAVQLRAERSGTGSGRAYGLTVRCSDAAGNEASDTASVTVPHSRP